MFKFTLGSYGAFVIFRDFVFRKAVAVERNGPKFESFVHTEYLSLLSVQGHSVRSQCLTTLYPHLKFLRLFLLLNLYLTGTLLSLSNDQADRQGPWASSC